MNTIKILSAKDVKWEDYKNLRLEALQKEPQAFGSSYEDEKKYSDEEWENRLEKYKKGDGDWMIFASEQNELVGMMGAFQTEEDKKNNMAEIIAVYVKETSRGKGVAKILMQTILDLLAKCNLSKVKLAVSLEQIAAVKLYESFGFSIIKQDGMVLGDEKYHEEYIMEKEL